MPDLNMRAADPCPTNNAKRAKHSKILKPGCFFVFTPFYQWTNSVLCETASSMDYGVWSMEAKQFLVEFVQVISVGQPSTAREN
jgi:hypothetical protein